MSRISRGPQAERVKVGARFGRLVIYREPYMEVRGKNPYPQRFCPCRCECGSLLDVRASGLLTGNTQSCGCLHRERTSKSNTKHGEGHSLLYATWCAMKDRCGNPKNKRFANYGGRGISICPEWITDFAAFREWAQANGYEEGLTIERGDVNGNYEPSNCTWIPAKAQALNRTSTVYLTAFGETKIFQQWVDDPRCKVGRLTLHSRIKVGWDAEFAITAPAQRKGVTKNYFRNKPVKTN